MSIRATVGSFSKSHRAKHSRPDWTNFTSNPQGFRLQRIFRFPNYEAPPQIVADLEFSATDPANAPARAEFKLGIFPPDHHVPPVTPTPLTPPAT